ncbi:MAG: MFS transporter, partial [Comamonas sp.]
MKMKLPPFVWVSFAMIVGVMGTALISPLYALYKESWQLQASDISLIYVIYMGGALCSLLFMGRLPDRVGFRPVMKAGLLLTLLGTVISLCAWNMTSLIVGRFVVGVASSLITTSASHGLASVSPPGQLHRVAMMTGFLLAFGFGLGPLVGGVMGQWAPYPLRTTYIPTLVLGCIGFFVLSRLQLPATAQAHEAKPLRLKDVLPKLTWPEREASWAFTLTCAVPFLAFGVFGLYASLSPLFLDKLVPWHGPVVSGTAIAVILFASATVQYMAGNLPPHLCGFLGLWSLALSNL